MKRFFMGHSPNTSLSGYILSALLVIQELKNTGIHDWHQMILPVAIALFGRIAGDDHPRSGPPPDASYSGSFTND